MWYVCAHIGVFTLYIYSSAAIMVIAILNALYLRRQNRLKIEKRDEILAPYMEDGKSTDGGERAWLELGDRHPDFKYTY